MTAEPSVDRSGREGNFRREAAHALSTPLGSLLLQAEMIEHYLRQDKVPKAQQAVTTWVADCESFGRLMRSVFSAMSDMAKEGGGHGDPCTCLAEALAELGDAAIAITYRGDSPGVAVPATALTALMRRLAMEATDIDARDLVLSATTEGTALRLSLLGQATPMTALPSNPFAKDGSLNLATIHEIAHRYQGHLSIADASPALLDIVLPIAVPPRRTVSSRP